MLESKYIVRVTIFVLSQFAFHDYLLEAETDDEAKDEARVVVRQIQAKWYQRIGSVEVLKLVDSISVKDLK